MQPTPYDGEHAIGVIVDPEPDERGQLLAFATLTGGRRIALALNVN